MKRVHIEPWTTKEKLCLASAVLHSGDQNWMSVSRILRMYGESNRPMDWYSQKQCAVQYECLLNTAGTPKRKKRSEKGVETLDIPEEAIVRKLTQERIEELKMLIAEDRADYLRIKKLQEEVDGGKLDDRLDEAKLQLEEEIRKDKERLSLNNFEARKPDGDMSSRLVLLTKTFGHTGQDVDGNDSSVEVEVKHSPTPTSPLLTSLLQSPSPSLLHRTSSSTPTISSLLHSSPSIPRVHDPPTLSKLLESPSPTHHSSTPIKTKDNTAVSNVPENKEKETSVTEVQSIEQDELSTADVISESTIKSTEDEEVAYSPCPEKKPSVVRRLDLEISPQDLEKEEKSSLNLTQDSDTLEEQEQEQEQLEAEMELDSEAVDMIVMGPNQSAVIAVHHDISNEHIDEEGVTREETSTHEIVKEECEEVTEETVVSINEEDMSKPVEDALKIINDARVVVAESDQAVEVEMPVEEIQENPTGVEEVIGSELKDIVAEEQVVLEEIVTEEIKEETVEDTQTVKDVSVENTEEEIVLKEAKTNINEKEAVIEMKVQPEPSVEEVALNNKQNSEAVPGDATDIVIKVEENEKKKGTTETKDEQTEVNLNVIDVKPKKVGRRRKSSKDNEEKESTKVKETLSVRSPPLRASLEKEPTELSVSIKHPVSSARVKERRKSTLSTKELPPSISQKEEELNESSLSSEPVSLSVMAKEPVTCTTSVKETPLILPPPESVVSDFKVPRSDTPSTTDEDNEPIISYISKRGKYKRNSGVDSKPNSPSPQTFDEGSKEFRAWKKSIMLVYNRLSTHKYASIFLRPITNERARGYHTVIHRPMDLSTLKKNIEYGQIRTTVEFQRDVMLMFQNAIMYNNTNTEIFEMASVMQRECIQHFQLMVEAMGEGVPWRESAINSEKATRTRLKADDMPPSRKRAHNSTGEDNKLTIPAKRKKILTP